jgi:hypothetical protein
MMSLGDALVSLVRHPQREMRFRRVPDRQAVQPVATCFL